jgi:hypothetical protein
MKGPEPSASAFSFGDFIAKKSFDRPRRSFDRQERVTCFAFDRVEGNGQSSRENEFLKVGH